jgi:chromosome condensin MukBEF MukE localization factor
MSSILFTSMYQFPQTIVDLLPVSDVATLSSLNTIMNNDMKIYMKKYRNDKIEELLYYFYYSDPVNSRISIYTRYHSYYAKNVRDLFYFLPELFDFIKQKNITSLDLSCITSYGGYPESPERMICNEINTIQFISNQLIKLVSDNDTLTYCNLGMFLYYIDRDKLRTEICKNKTLQLLSLQPNGSTTYFNKPPNTLYRRQDIFLWSHFKP